jgi:hypothetical protein
MKTGKNVALRLNMGESADKIRQSRYTPFGPLHLGGMDAAVKEILIAKSFTA